jgi:hypothetical protein
MESRLLFQGCRSEAGADRGLAGRLVLVHSGRGRLDLRGARNDARGEVRRLVELAEGQPF